MARTSPELAMAPTYGLVLLLLLMMTGDVLAIRASETSRWEFQETIAGCVAINNIRDSGIDSLCL
jgi:hypothetical protein